jgi:hypothetical protein
MTHEAQWLALALACLVTAGVLTLDALLWRALGPDATFSRALAALFSRWPVALALFLLWLGIIIGHLLPARP